MVEFFSLTLAHSNLLINIFLISAFILNLIFAFTIIFMERRSAGSIWAWLLVLVFLPIIGFILYLLLGRQIQREQIFKLNKNNKIGLEMIVGEQMRALESDNFSKGNHQIVKYKDMVKQNSIRSLMISIMRKIIYIFNITFLKVMTWVIRY